jgi:hypothetical protein
MIKKFGMHQRVITNILKEDDLDYFDNSAFQLWKSELQKELPNFWESFDDLNNDYNQDIISKKNDLLN